MAKFSYEGVINLGYDTTFKTRAAINCTKTSSTQITLSIDKSSATNYLQFPNGNTNISLHVGLATSASGSYTYKQVYYGWDPLPGSQSRGFTDSQSWSYTVGVSDTSKTIYVKFKVVDEGSGASVIISSNPTSATFSFAAGTTLSTNPTSVTASGVYKPGAAVTISWSGVTKGTNNTVAGYSLFYAASTNGAAPTTGASSTFVSTSALSGSTTFTIPTTATRGNKYAFGMRTKSGTAVSGSSYPSGLKTGGVVTVNTLPTKPTLSITAATISSGSSGQKVTATAGTDTDGQTYSVYYANGPSGTKTKGTSVTINPAVGSALTYYFWTYDGLEYSTSASCTVTKAVQPSIAVTTSSLLSYTALGDGNTYYYSVTAALTASGASSGTIYYQWYYRQYKNEAWSDWTKFSYGSGQATGTSKTWTCNFNVAGAEVYKGYPTEWKVGFWFNNGVENSEEVFVGPYPYSARPASLGAGTPSAGNPKVTRYNGNASGFDDTGTNSSKFIGKWIRVRYPKDGSQTSTNVHTVLDVQTNQSLAFSVQESDTNNPYGDNITYHNIDIILDDWAPIGHQVKIGIKIGCGNIIKNVYEGAWGATHIGTPMPTIGYETSFSNYQVYGTASDLFATDFQLSVSDSAALSGCTWNWITATSDNTKSIIKNFTSGPSLSGGSYAAAMSREGIYNFEETLNLTYAGTTPMNCGIQFTNMYGRTVTATQPVTFNFDTQPTATWSTPSYSTDISASNPTSSLNGKYIQEGLRVKFNGNIQYYSGRNLQVDVLQNAVVLSSKIINVAAATNRVAKTASYSLVGNINAIASETTNFQIRVTPLSAAASYISVTESGLNSIKFVDPIQSFTSASISGSSILVSASASTIVAVPAAGISSQSVEYFLANGDKDLTNHIGYSSSSQYTFTFGSDSDWTSQNAYFVALASVQGNTGFITSKQFNSSNAILLSKDNPTVSYRKNFVGINTPANMAAPSGEAIRIHAIAGHNSVSFRDENGLQTAEFVAQNSSGLAQLAFPSATDTRVEMNSNGIYMNGTENHIQVKNLDITPTSISLPSNGKIYINSNDLLLDILHPVGSVICMSSNTNPGTRLGGTWSYVDKGFSYFSTNSITNLFTPDSTNVSSAAILVYRDFHTITIRLTLTTAIALSGTNKTMGTFTPSALGLVDTNIMYTQYINGTSEGQGSTMAYLNYLGKLEHMDFFPKTSGSSLTAGSTVYYEWTFTVPQSAMLDSACDKFYFKRTV